MVNILIATLPAPRKFSGNRRWLDWLDVSVKKVPLSCWLSQEVTLLPVTVKLSRPRRSVLPFQAFTANVGVIGIAAFDIVLIDIVPPVVDFGLNTVVSILVPDVTAVDVDVTIIVIIIPAFGLDAFILVFAPHIAAVNVSKACGGQGEGQCEGDQQGFHGEVISSVG
jgi:hypothetical protein